MLLDRFGLKEKLKKDFGKSKFELSEGPLGDVLRTSKGRPESTSKGRPLKFRTSFQDVPRVSDQDVSGMVKQDL